MTDALGVAGRRRLDASSFPPTSATRSTPPRARSTSSTGRLPRSSASWSPSSSPQEHARLMTVPGVGLITAAAFMAHAATSRALRPGRLVGYLDLDPRVRQSGGGPGHTGRSPRRAQRSCATCWSRPRTPPCAHPGPLRAFSERVGARRGHQIAVVPVARKMCALFWHLLTRGPGLRLLNPTTTAKKMRAVEVKAGASRRQGKNARQPLSREQRREVERRMASTPGGRRAHGRRLAPPATPTKDTAPTRT